MRQFFHWRPKAAAAGPAAEHNPPERSVTTAPSSTKTFPSGIKLLYSAANATVDIVFIHGLTGDRERTWTARNASEPWPKTLLPAELPTARVLTFGYDAYVTDWKGMVSQSRIGDHASNLLTSLASYRDRDNTNERPIIFVCHSMGGLVCEDALFKSKQRTEPHLSNILRFTYGIAFLGTPHYGSGLAQWAERLSRSLGIIKQTNTQIVEVLKLLVPYARNPGFVGRSDMLEKLKGQLGHRQRQTKLHFRAALYGLGGIGKTQIALAHAYWLQEECPDVSVFWVHASSAERFRQSYASIAQECHVPGHDDPKADVVSLLKKWLEMKDRGRWLMVVDNADDARLASGPEGLGRHIPECAHGSVLVTTRNKEAGSRLTRGGRPIEVKNMDDGESKELLKTKLEEDNIDPSDIAALSSRLEHLPLALVQAAAFMLEKSVSISKYLELLDKSDQDLADLLSRDFETVGRDSETPRAVTETWILSFDQILQQNPFAGDLLALMGLLDRQAIPLEFLSTYDKQQPEQQGELQLTEALGVLKAFSFVVEDKDHVLDMHRLVQLVTRKWLVENGRMRHFAGQALLAVSDCYPFGEYENWGACSAYLAHVYAVLGGEGTSSREEKAAKATLLHSVAGFFMYRGQWKDAERFQLEAV
ncbi:P-loop containing nucleoside triphosphate hydrolase protein, partial [Staphylotrichum tortipilum]